MTEANRKIGRWIAAALVIGGLATVFHNLLVDNMPKGEVREVGNYTPWSAETLRIVDDIPVQDGGRIKPLSTYAGFTMLGMHGARSMKISDGEGNEYRLRPTEWLFDILFRPQFAIHQPTFRVDNSAAIEAIGVAPRGRRDRYSYADISPGRDRLGELARQFSSIESDKRDAMQNQLLDLASNVRHYEGLLGWFSFARSGVILIGSGEDGGPDKRADLSGMMTVAPMLQEQIEESRAAGRGLPANLIDLLEQIRDASNLAKNDLFILPPADPEEREWRSAGNAIMEVMQAQMENPQTFIGDIRALEALARSLAESEERFREFLVGLRDRTTARAGERGEGRWVSMEASYYRMNWFLQAMVFFLLGSLTAMAMWTLGGNRAGRICSWATLALTAAGTIYCTIAIVQRSIIMQRPPVGNLYDTIIFIGTTVVMLSLAVEWLAGRRFALGVAPILGTGFIIFARRFELGDGADHMDPLVAVLDSNFWLTTHVITITLGYSAGLLSAFLSSGYVIFRGLGLDGGDRERRRSLTRAVYGMLCVTLFLSLVGTVLGGIWANYSWGRFWGWDPKENGALMIVIWVLAILHARLGGYIREWGIHLASIFTAVIVTFSWWHVNFLGVGLHSYGFTSEQNTIWTFYGCMAAILIIGFIAMLVDKARGEERGDQRPSASNTLPTGSPTTLS